MAYIAAIECTIALVLTLLLLRKQPRRRQDLWLAVWYVVLTIHVVLLLPVSASTDTPADVILLSAPLFLVYGPVLLGYVKAVTDKGSISQWHFLPALAMATLLFGLFYLQAPLRLQLDGTVLHLRGPGSVALRLFLQLMFLGYLFYPAYAIYLVKTHQQHLRSRFSNITEMDLRWVEYWIYSIVAGAAGVLIFNLRPISPGDQWIMLLMVGFVALQMIYAGIKGLAQSDIFQSTTSEVKQLTLDFPEPDFIRRPHAPVASAPRDNWAAEVEELEQSMDADMPHLDCHLTLEKLAAQLGWTTDELSQVLNRGVGSSFYEYVNRHRVKEVQRVMSDPRYREATVLSIAYAAGFNSKTAFNASFRRYAGMTPSEYRRSIAEQAEAHHPRDLLR